MMQREIKKTKTLEDLENEKIIKFNKRFGSWGTPTKNDLSRFRLVRVGLAHNCLKLHVKTEVKDGLYDFITFYPKNSNPNLAQEIQEILKNWTGKTVKDIYQAKLFT